MLLQLIKDPRSSFLIKGGKWSFLHTKAVHLLITRKILVKINKCWLTYNEKLNIDGGLKVTWEGFIHISEIIFTAAQQAASLFKDTKVTRVNISFLEFDQNAALRLKTSKTDINHIWVLILIGARHDQNCSLAAFYKLFFRNFQPTYAPLFSQTKRAVKY